MQFSIRNFSQKLMEQLINIFLFLTEKGILPIECKETADVLLFFDKLFDSVNGGFGKKKHAKPLLGAATPNSVHHKFWKEAIKTLKSMEYINNKSLAHKHVPTLKNWIWTLEGIQMLLKKIKNKYEISSIWLRHLNQDPLENYFGSIRSHGCRNTNPTAEKFESAFATLLINCLSSVNTPGANCESDTCHALYQVIITNGDKKQTICRIESIPDIILTPLEEKHDLRIIGGLQYVSGYFVKNAKKTCIQGV